MKSNFKGKDHALYISTDKNSSSVDDWDIYDSNGENDVTITETIETGENVSISSSPDQNLDVSGNIQIENDSGTISFDGPDPQEIQRRKNVCKGQLEKIQKLIESVIEAIGESDLGHSEIEKCKSDLKTVRDLEHRLRNTIEKAEMFSWNWGSEAILSPDELETLNDIYRRWM
jgi:hypothetical protein